jgi:hypothetical protein
VALLLASSSRNFSTLASLIIGVSSGQPTMVLAIA